MPGGRPTTYKEQYCEDVIEYGSQGKSFAWIAGKIGVSRECVYEWARTHPEFSDALAKSRMLSQMWWEDLGQRAFEEDQRGFLSSLWAKNVSCRFREDWTDSTKTELTGANGGPVQVQRIERVIVDAKKEGE